MLHKQLSDVPVCHVHSQQVRISHVSFNYDGQVKHFITNYSAFIKTLSDSFAAQNNSAGLHQAAGRHLETGRRRRSRQRCWKVAGQWRWLAWGGRFASDTHQSALAVYSYNPKMFFM